MSAPRRTATRGPQTAGGSNPSGIVGSAAPAPVPARPARPVAPKPVEAPKNRFGQAIASFRRNIDDTIAELKKVNWPDRETTRNLTLLVIALSAFLGLLLGGIDLVLARVFQAIG
ncbi:MAG: preprotein translocase subunit SecE [Thermomicrobiales bacterium]